MNEKAERLRKVATGMGLIYYGVCLFMLAIIINGVGGGLLAGQIQNNPQIRGAGRPPFNKNNPFQIDPNAQRKAVEAIAQSGRSTVVVFVLGALVGLASELLQLIGKLVSLAVPPDCAGAPLLYVSVALTAIASLHQAYTLFATFGVLPAVPPLIAAFVGLLSLTASILFMVFLQQLGNYIRRRHLADRALWVLKWTIIAVVLFVFLLVASLVGVAIVGPIAFLGICGALGVLIFLLVILVRYAKLLLAMKSALYARADSLGASGADLDQVETLD